MSDVREYTNKLLEKCEEEMLSWESVVREMMCWMSESEVREFYNGAWAGELNEEVAEDE